MNGSSKWMELDMLKKVYSWMEDEQSKDTFIHRLNYLVSGDRNWMVSLAKKYNQNILDAWDGLDIRDEIRRLGNGREIILYGAGRDGEEFLRLNNNSWHGWNLPIKCFCDKDIRKQKSGWRGYPVISPETLFSNHKEAIIIITAVKYETEILGSLIVGGFSKKQILFGLRYGMRYDSGQYFCEDFLKYEEEEIFIDAGAYFLETTVFFKQICSSLTKSYAFEPDPKAYLRCVKRVENENMNYVKLFPFGTWSSKKSLSFQLGNIGDSRVVSNDKGMENTIIETRAIDDIISERVTFIKMDVEKAELESLKGAKKTIQKYHPKLAICVYHRPEDIIRIPLYIKEIVPDYKLFMRHYSTHETETVLYAVV